MEIISPEDSLFQLSSHAFMDEAEAVQQLLSQTREFHYKADAIEQTAQSLITRLRDAGTGSGVEAFLHTYGLDTAEGIAVMCLAEALLRIPDPETADKLIEDTFSESNWKQFLGSDSLFVNASTWGLLLTGKIINVDKAQRPNEPVSVMRSLIKSYGEPVIRKSLKTAMKIIGDQFVLGQTIDRAIKRAAPTEAKGYTTSYDMLGEGARTKKQAEGFFASYMEAIEKVGATAKQEKFRQRPGVSVKLSALDPHYFYAHRDHVHKAILPQLQELARAAMDQGIPLTLDAEESYRLDIQLELFEALVADRQFKDYHGLGLVCQAYQKRATYLVDWVIELAKTHHKRIPLRLVKGAYWDSEIKWAQVAGLPGYPVFTQKPFTDVSYLACAGKMLAEPKLIYPQFATHNALTVASIIEVAKKGEFEFQRLYGMGQTLYEDVIPDYPCRVYAPVGQHQDLLAYLIRRLLENGANSSFVNLLRNKDKTLEMLLENPLELSRKALRDEQVTAVPLPKDIYGPDRLNSPGLDFGNKAQLSLLQSAVERCLEEPGFEAPETATAEDIPAFYERANTAFAAWQETTVEERAHILEKMAGLMENNFHALMAQTIREAKKTYPDAVAEVREAIDFCRYYAQQAREICVTRNLPGPTGESNQLSLHPRGVYVCISPWNFPLAIFIGQIAAALVTGNAVLAKPAEQTPAVAAMAVDLFRKAGVLDDALQLVCGPGETVGAALVSHPDCAGVAFTGSTGAAKAIQRSLAEKDGPIVPLIAETGGQNCMVVESSALPEHAVDDIIMSAFGSAGQRCSALRVLYLQDDIADRLLPMLKGAMDALVVGRPEALETHVGPVIDAEAQANLNAHIEKMKQSCKHWHAAPADPALVATDSYVIPHMFEIESIQDLDREHFGPILHVVRYDDLRLDKVMDEINSSGFGLTFGVHSRILRTQNHVRRRIKAGNTYVNRNMIGATVGVQPFGGEGLSGTGPKAGGPFYLSRFATERTTTINTTAIGGNLELLQGVLVDAG